MRSNVIFSAVLALSLLIVATTFLSSQIFGIPVSQLTRDPAFTSDTHPLIGGLSNLGVLLWSVTTTICLFCFLLLHKVGPSTGSWFFLYFGMLTFLLMVDDLFMVHDDLVARYLGLGETVVYLFYLLATLIGIFSFLSFILSNTPYYFAVISISLFGSSVLADMTASYWPSDAVQVAIEDGVKFMGTAGWAGYFGITGYQLVTARLVSKKRSEQEEKGRLHYKSC